VTGRRLFEWEGVPVEDLARAWAAASLRVFARLGSTNDLARGLAAAGAPAGTVVLAEEQVAGRGRAGREWSSPPGLGLWISIVARPTGDPSLLPLRVGLAVAEALDPFLGDAPAQIKWPNDLLVGGRKLGGILCEGSWEAGGAGFVIVGVGLNVLHAASDFPEGIRERASSIALAAGAAPERRAVAGSVVPAVLAALGGPAELDAGHLARLAARDALRGLAVEVTDPTTGARLTRGTASGIAADGSLQVLPGDGGAPRSIRSGTVRPVSEPVQSSE
jgi:BirA family biotin operon repressor/biotin-[acetyl-CoA-carboxylase] ligase